MFALTYRKKLLNGSFKDDLWQIIYQVCQQKGYRVDPMQSDGDHLHILVDIDALDVAHQLKQISTYKIYNKHRNYLKKHFWKENTLGSDGYFVCSTGKASTETNQKCSEEQG
ncbi:IS200/IS605 family transposase [Pontibacter mangrovi]|uniref:IS200/IS605 family transposase n=1 Tax=Pontibacter mangrovi TaxID=2589816 RepID=UPI0015E3E3A2|nr:IS200/IS605 family transposase [Pontibacter mangrovi]